ncbi:MAG: glycosyltransferase, partial [Candidatus Kapaibacteriota bacterium]
MSYKNKENKLVSVVVYLHNKENSIVDFLEKIIATTCSLFEKTEIIVVNDFSTDFSVEKIKSSSILKNYKLTILQMSFHQGLEIAMTAGVDLSAGDFVYEFDDISIDYDLKYIEEAYRKLLEGNDIVSVSPKKINSISSQFFYKIYNSFSKSKYKIRTDRFRILSRRSINRAYSISISIPYRKALYANSGLKNETITYESINNNFNSKPTFRNKMAINALIIYTNLA